MVKVMNIISDTNVGGAGRVLLNYLRYMNKDKFSISVAVPRGSLLIDDLKKFEICIYEIDGIADKSLDFSAIKKLKDVIRRENPDIVHTHGSMSGRIAGRQCGKAVIYTRHSVFPVSNKIKHGPGKLLNKWINEHYADRIIAVSPAAKENLTDAGISPNLIDVIMNGVEPIQMLSAEERAAQRKRYCDEDVFLAAILARIEDYKGHITILDAAKKLASKGLKFKILIAGTGSFEEQAKQHAQSLQLGETVSFLGFVKDVTSLLNVLDVQLNASYGTEATSMSLLEGMSIGLPAVVSDYGGNPWLIEDGKTGYIFKSKDADALAACLEKLICDKQLLLSMHDSCRETFYTKYTGQIFAKNTEDVYIKTLEGKHNGK
jgi:glycosyltransferase involved in cell wall biosynthesis